MAFEISEAYVSLKARGLRDVDSAFDSSSSKLRGFSDRLDNVTGEFDVFGGRGARSIGLLTTAMGTLGTTAGLVATGFAAAGAGMLAALVPATRAAANLETELANVATISADVRDNFGEVAQAVNRLSVATRTDAGLLSQGLYQAISAGITDTSDALQFLEVAARAAKGGLTDVYTAVDGLSSVVNAFGEDAANVGNIADKFFKTVERGKLTFGDLAGSIGNVAPLASSLNVSLDELLATGASLTLTGQSLSEAFTGVRGILVAVARGDVAGALGEQFNSAALALKGLVGFLNDLQIAVDTSGQSMADVFGSVEALNVALALTGKQAGTTRSILSDLTNATGSLSNAVAIQERTFNEQVTLLRTRYSAAMRRLGQAVLPEATAALTGLNRVLESSGERITRLTSQLTSNAQRFRDQEQQAERLAGQYSDLRSRLSDLSPETDEARRLHSELNGIIGQLVAVVPELALQWDRERASLGELNNALERSREQHERMLSAEFLRGFGEFQKAISEAVDETERLERVSRAITGFGRALNIIDADVQLGSFAEVVRLADGRVMSTMQNLRRFGLSVDDARLAIRLLRQAMEAGAGGITAFGAAISIADGDIANLEGANAKLLSQLDQYIQAKGPEAVRAFEELSQAIRTLDDATPGERLKVDSQLDSLASTLDITTEQLSALIDNLNRLRQVETPGLPTEPQPQPAGPRALVPVSPAQRLQALAGMTPLQRREQANTEDLMEQLAFLRVPPRSRRETLRGPAPRPMIEPQREFRATQPPVDIGAEDLVRDINRIVERYRNWSLESENLTATVSEQLSFLRNEFEMLGVTEQQMREQSAEAWVAWRDTVVPLEQRVLRQAQENAKKLEGVHVPTLGRITNAFSDFFGNVMAGYEGLSEPYEQALNDIADAQARNIADRLALEGRGLEARLLLFDREAEKARDAFADQVEGFKNAQELMTQFQEEQSRARALIEEEYTKQARTDAVERVLRMEGEARVRGFELRGMDLEASLARFDEAARQSRGQFVELVSELEDAPALIERYTEAQARQREQFEAGLRSMQRASSAQLGRALGGQLARDLPGANAIIQGAAAGGIVGAFAGLAAEVIASTSAFEQLQEEVSLTFAALVEAVEPVVEMLTQTLEPALRGFASLLNALGPIFELTGKVTEFALKPLELWGRGLEWIGNRFSDLMGVETEQERQTREFQEQQAAGRQPRRTRGDEGDVAGTPGQRRVTHRTRPPQEPEADLAARERARGFTIGTITGPARDILTDAIQVMSSRLEMPLQAIKVNTANMLAVLQGQDAPSVTVVEWEQLMSRLSALAVPSLEGVLPVPQLPELARTQPVQTAGDVQGDGSWAGGGFHVENLNVQVDAQLQDSQDVPALARQLADDIERELNQRWRDEWRATGNRGRVANAR